MLRQVWEGAIVSAVVHAQIDSRAQVLERLADISDRHGPEGMAARLRDLRALTSSDLAECEAVLAAIPHGPSRVRQAAGHLLDLGGKARYGSFDPLAQDRAAVDLIKRRGMWAAVIAGQIDQAAYGLRSEWEMFTQAKWAPALAQARFHELGGVQT